jgi:hypothetical protein
MKGHHARGPEETVQDLPPLVPTGPARRSPATCLRQTGMPNRAAAEDAGKLASSEPGLLRRVPDPAARGTDRPASGAAANAAPMNRLPWDLAKDQFSIQGADFIGVLGRLLLRTAKDQFVAYHSDSTTVSGTLPLPPRKTRPGFAHTEPRAASDATGVSPTGPALGTSARPPTAPPAAAAGIAG